MAGISGGNASVIYWMGWFCGLGKANQKSQLQFISGEAGVIHAGVCWVMEPAFITVLREVGRPLDLYVSHGNSCLITAKEIWVRAAPSPGQDFGSQGSGCAHWHKHGPHQGHIPGGSAASSCVPVTWAGKQDGWGEGRVSHHIQHGDCVCWELNQKVQFQEAS